MELRQIKYFIEVAKREHVTEAANALHVAQSAVSRQIFNLEAELGVELFIREGRNVRLTPMGRIFLDHMEQAMNVIYNALQVVEEYMEPERGTIHIGYTSSMASYLLPTAISAFRVQYPNVKFELNQGAYHELIDWVHRGNINLALLAPLPKETKGMEGSVLFHERIVALLPRNHSLATASSIKLNQLRTDAFIFFPEGFMLRDITLKACQQHGFQPDIAFEGADMDAVKGMVSAGLGVALVPEITLVDNIPRSAVKVPIVDPSIMRTVGVLVSEERKLLPTEKLFHTFLHHFFRRLEQYQK
ncbi:LysR family transcriptional regulator [Virgibacillus sp. LDC-1]|uniref:LysR family transcriptional regulator n=1 Tax=Virgibacillus sp. LDC-1 TaxID=3039856 RepID=UPI0024DEC65F|nr:LysR family transcriptional regulator [Virgibacillus sp. LDC-1]